MQESKEVYMGRFWLPVRGEESAVSGMLMLHERGATLHLPDVLSEAELEDATIFARLQGSCEYATLQNCYGSWTRDGAGRIVRARVSSTLVALGCAREELAGNALGFRIPGSERWLDEKCFEVDHGDGERISISFTGWKQARAQLTDDLALERTYAAAISGDTYGVEEYSVTRRMCFHLRSRSTLSLDEYWDLLWTLQRFFAFCTQSPMCVENLELFDNEDGVEHGSGALIHVGSAGVEPAKAINRHDFLVHAQDVRERVDDLICRWVRLVRSDPAPFYHYFHAFDRRRQDGVLHFVWNVAAVEELHKMRHGRRKMDLLDRLRDMTSRWKDAFSLPPQDETLEHIKDSRHYHAHAAGDLRERAAKGWLLLRYGDFLMALANLEILSLLGFQLQEAVKLTRHNLWMREALDLTTYPGPDI